MNHGQRPNRIAAFAAEKVNIQQLQDASETFGRSNRRLTLVSDQQAALRGYNGPSELNFAITETTAELDASEYEALVLLEGAMLLDASAHALIKLFLAADKPVIALTGSAALLADHTTTALDAPESAAAILGGNLYVNADEDCDLKIVEAIAKHLLATNGGAAPETKRRAGGRF
jgi:putative intracellular protease/amidase